MTPYEQGFMDKCAELGVDGRRLLLKVAAAVGWGGYAPRAAVPPAPRPMPRRTYLRAGKVQPPPPKSTLRSRDRWGAPPPMSAEGRLNSVGANALMAMPFAAAAAPVVATVGGVTGALHGVKSGHGVPGAVAEGLVGAGTAFIPGTTGVVNTAAGGGIETAASAALDNMR